MWEMPAWRFLLLVSRLEAYAGAVAARMNVQRQQQRQERQPAGGQDRMGQAERPALPVPQGARVIGATAAEIGMSDIGDLFSHGSSGGR